MGPRGGEIRGWVRLRRFRAGEPGQQGGLGHGRQLRRDREYRGLAGEHWQAWLMREACSLGMCLVECVQRVADGLGHEASHGGFFPELHLALLRVDVHIDRCRIDFQEQTANGITPAHQGRVIALSQCKMEPPILDRALVDEEVLFVA